MAGIGDQVIIRGRHTDDADRSGVITALLGERDTAPCSVRFRDGRGRLIVSGQGATILPCDPPGTLPAPDRLGGLEARRRVGVP